MGVDLVEVWNIVAGYLSHLHAVVDDLLAGDRPATAEP